MEDTLFPRGKVTPAAAAAAAGGAGGATRAPRVERLFGGHTSSTTERGRSASGKRATDGKGEKGEARSRPASSTRRAAVTFEPTDAAAAAAAAASRRADELSFKVCEAVNVVVATPPSR